QRREPSFAGIHRLELLLFAFTVGQARGDARVEKWNGEVTRVAALVTGARVRRQADESAVRTIFFERRDIAEPWAFHFFSFSARIRIRRRHLRFLLHAWVGHHWNLVERSGNIRPRKFGMRK